MNSGASLPNVQSRSGDDPHACGPVLVFYTGRKHKYKSASRHRPGVGSYGRTEGTAGRAELQAGLEHHGVLER